MPPDVIDPLLWRDAQLMLGRHAEPGYDDRCVWCGLRWPCPPRRLAERAAAAARRPACGNGGYGRHEDPRVSGRADPHANGWRDPRWARWHDQPADGWNEPPPSEAAWTDPPPSRWRLPDQEGWSHSNGWRDRASNGWHQPSVAAGGPAEQDHLVA